MLLGQRTTLPLVDVVGPEYVDPVDVREVEDRVVAGGIRQFDQNLVQQHRLRGNRSGVDSVVGGEEGGPTCVSALVCVRYRFVHLQLHVVLVAEQLVRPR